MLKIIMPLLILMLMNSIKHYWWVTMSSLFILTFIFIINLTQFNQMNFMLSTFSSMDTMSSTLIILSVLIAALMMMASSKIFITYSNFKLFSIMNLTLLIILINCFASANIIMFYIWFEASLIPTMVIIMTWGYQPERLQASMYLMMYTITASLPMFIMFCSMYLYSNHLLMPMTSELYFPCFFSMSSMFWIMTLAGFLVKLPMFSTHLWLPKAHVEAPIAGSMVLAAILLKLGGYGLARMSFLYQNMVTLSSAMLMSISMVGAVITSLICMRQPDLKSLIAYSSVGHMGLMLTGMMSNTSWGMTGSLMMMVAHGLSSSALFIMANLSYEITHTRSMFLTKGLMTINPIMTMWWFLFTAANMAAPPSINLLSEITLITSTLSKSFILWTLLGLVSFLTAMYSLHMYTTTQHGQISNYTNPLYTLKPKDMLLLLIHMYPLIMLIMKPELISVWTW